MNKRRIWLGLVVLALVLFGLASWPTRPREPSYQGRNLSAWLHELVVNEDSTNAAAAVRAIGTNAIPYLLERLASNPNRPSALIVNAANKLFCDWLSVRNQPWDNHLGADISEGLVGFESLGPAAGNAVPALSRLLGKPNSTGSEAAVIVSQYAAISLAFVGHAGLPPLMEALTNRSAAVRFNALWGLHLLRGNADPALPAVLRCLNDTNVVEGTPVRLNAIRALGSMHDGAASAGSALTNFLTDPDSHFRRETLHSLYRLGPDAKLAIPAITAALADLDPRVRYAATNALRSITPPSGGVDPPR